MENLHLNAPSERELMFRALWRRFYETIAIEGRRNERCRMSHMPKRYWGNMTEFQEDDPKAPVAVPVTWTEGGQAEPDYLGTLQV
jgi:hypothetical protein